MCVLVYRPGVGQAMKNLFAPNVSTVTQLEEYIATTLWGSDTDRVAELTTVQDAAYGVRASMFYSGTYCVQCV